MAPSDSLGPELAAMGGTMTANLPHVILVDGTPVYYTVRPATLADVGQAGRLARQAGIPASVIRMNSYTGMRAVYFVQAMNGECYVIDFTHAWDDNVGVQTLNKAARIIARYA